MTSRAFALTTLAMIAFAANSLLCREALRTGAIDAASFTVIRTACAAVMLCLLLLWRDRKLRPSGRPVMAVMLFLYMVGFSLAYLELTAATGALLLFGAVQLTMLARALMNGERPGIFAWLGWAGAVAGLLILLSPGAEAPDLKGAVLMGGAGVAWGIYSLLGRGVDDPLGVTAGNFLMALPLTLIVLAMIPGLFAMPLTITSHGIMLAAASGALASGLGYVIWYAALRQLTSSTAATVQLSVPLIAALGGALLLAEPVTSRLVLASVLTLGGIGLVLGRQQGR